MMLTTVFATKLGMTQAWTTTGKRLAVTRCKVEPNVVVGTQPAAPAGQQILEIGYGPKKLKNVPKPLRARLEKSGFSMGVRQVQGVMVSTADATADSAAPSSAETDTATPAASGFTVGQTIAIDQVLTVGDVVKVQGTTKGRGFAGAMKRHGFHGGPKTHGQSDRGRAVGSIGAGTTPGRVLKGQRMPGHYGVETQTVANLVVLKVDVANQEVWLSGPVPGATKGMIKIIKTGAQTKIELDQPTPVVVVTESAPVEEVTA